MLPRAEDDPADPNLTVRIGDRVVLIRDRYETASIINDILIALEFFIGSWYFLYPDHEPGVWLFIIGSAQLAIRPALRLARRVTLRKLVRQKHLGDPRDDQDEF